MGETRSGHDAGASDVMAAVDADGSTAEFVIADVGRDDAWLSMPDAVAATLDEWR
jgi:hypothetical protein